MTRRKPRVWLIAVTGGPCGGKSTFMAKAREHLEKHGMRTVYLSEVATELMQAGFSPVHGWDDSYKFQLHVLKYSIQRENAYVAMMRDLAHSDSPLVILCDRGALDGMAYAGEQGFALVAGALNMAPFSLMERYDAVIHLVTAADGAEQYYTLANNPQRTETPQEARLLDQKTEKAWKGHRHHSIIDNSTGFNDKVRRAVESLARVLHMPEPTEKERKFLIDNWEEISASVTQEKSVRIIQHYLRPTVAGTERRVRNRRSHADNGSAFYYTEKRQTRELGVRIEIENPISLAEYRTLLEDCDPQTEPIEKDRYYVRSAGHIIEVDVYAAPSRVEGLVVAEVEVADMNAPIVFPPEWRVTEVTGNEAYSNHALALL